MTDKQALFHSLYRASTESEVDKVIERRPDIFRQGNWRPYGQSESYFAVVENQQASPVPALVEKIINAIDAILMRRCREEGIDPKSQTAPQSVDAAVERFFPNCKDWDYKTDRRRQAEHIQVLADGPRRNTSLVIYDNGEGQHPDDFEVTFLSLLRGNKNEIHFVQGKYNMGGSGAIAFCGKRRYQLIGSKRYDGNGRFGYTLMRKHPLNDEERLSRKNTWYEYLVVDGHIPSFDVDEMDLGLYRRLFRTGSIIKLYSYDLPSGISDISRDLNQSINEYLFEPALPLYIVESEKRYPKNMALRRHLYGLKRRLEEEGSDYIEDMFSSTYCDRRVGHLKITGYVFRARVKGRDAKESKEVIRREFFKNNMAVLFSVNGQVHGHYTSEFITRSLKYPLLKGFLLIHVDCTRLDPEFRGELFMASRDRLKIGEESRMLRRIVAEALRKSKLKDIYRQRRQAITVGSSDTDKLLRELTKNIPLKQDLLSLLDESFKTDRRVRKRTSKKGRATKGKRREVPFESQRYPSFFRIQTKQRAQDGLPMVGVPLGGNRTVRFATDVENEYFDRVEDPGHLHVAVNDRVCDQGGGIRPEVSRRVDSLFNVTHASPNEGTISVSFNPNGVLQVGDSCRIRAVLSGAGQVFEQLFWIRIVDSEKRTAVPSKSIRREDKRIALPDYQLVYKERRNDDGLSWDMLESQGIAMGYDEVMHPLVEGEKLAIIYINMDSRVLRTYKSRNAEELTLELAHKRYISTVYFHTLFLYAITSKRQYTVYQQSEGMATVSNPVDLAEYLKDVFSSHYSAFLLNFEMGDLVASLED